MVIIFKAHQNQLWIWFDTIKIVLIFDPGANLYDGVLFSIYLMFLLNYMVVMDHCLSTKQMHLKIIANTVSC